ncbi:MAG: hypothetical protein HQL41_09050, partial [Alphaproteobacteria bacterium]|nr:hypothetical protein [Alphaproteobacteria bacterium]
MTSLLPPNASPLERLIEAATALDARTPSLGIVRTAKMDADPRLIPWLLWEYGLGELLPWLADPRRALDEGIRFHRLRGTPASLAMALGWLDLADAAIEEHGPGRARISFEFQIDPGRVLNPDEARAVVAVAALAAPARSRLVRLYHGWDQRPFVLDRTPLGEGLISDFSGPLLDGVRQSFGLRHAAHLTAPAATVALGVLAGHAARAWYRDRWMLDEM